MSVNFEIMNKDHVKLAWSFSVNESSCANHELFENFIKFSALTDMASGNNVTHVLVDNNEKTKEKIMIGFVALRASSYIMQCHGESEANGDPALEIQYLAVDKKYEHQGNGTLLVSKVIDLAAQLCEKYIGVNYIVLRSDEKAVKFYETIRFKKLSEIGKIPSGEWNANCTPLIAKIETWE